MKIIYKYELSLVEYQEIELPKGFQILTVQMQREKICIWALIDNDWQTESVPFAIIGTGNSFDCEPYWKYIGTVQPTDHLVFHVFQGNKTNT